MELGLEGRPALVAAASRGLGRASALALAREGARVAICGRDRGRIEEARDAITEDTGRPVVALTADVAREEDAVRFVREGSEAVGGCQILVTNAGGPPIGRFDELDDGDFRSALDLLFFSAIRMSREALSHMRSAGYGRIVMISSLSVREPVRNLILSSSSRAALGGWAKTLSDEVGADGITVNAVLPGRVWTDRIRQITERLARDEGRTLEEQRAVEEAVIPVGRFGDPDDVGAAVAFLASDRAGYISGASLVVDGGLHRGLH